jgi:hypothetical protein
LVGILGWKGEPDLLERFYRAGKSWLKRKLLKAILAFLLPYLPVLVPVIVTFLIITLLVAAVYGAMAPQKALAGLEPSPQDKVMQEQYQKLCDKYNVADTWVVNEKMVMPEDGDAYEASPEKPFYPGKGVRNLHTLADRYGNDQKEVLTWGMVHSASLYWTFINSKAEIPDSIKEQVAKDLHPYFYYKLSAVIISGKDGSETVPVHLLVEAYTIQGHYQYHYQWVSETRGEGENAVTVTYEKLYDIKQILPNPYQRLDDYLKQLYKISDNTITVDRTAVWEASRGFNNQAEWFAWLLGDRPINDFISGAMVPPELMSYFKEAEAKYGIPWWFLAAIAFKESSFDPKAENPDTKCYGLMQLSPTNWEEKAPKLGFDPVQDRDNPRAQILVGAYMLHELGLGSNIDWKGNWQEQVLPVLAFYGGYRGTDALQRCLIEYARPIYEYAARFQSFASTWPVPSSRQITDTYHPVATALRRAHHGIDIAANMGAEVVSVSAGKVVFTGYDQTYGNYIDVTDGMHLYRYAHLSRIIINQGDSVTPGQLIGLVGSTGKSTGPHLHFEVHVLPNGGTIDPLLVLVAG